MLTKKDFGRLEKVFHTLPLTKGLTFWKRVDGCVALSLNFPYSGIQGVAEIDTFFFDEEEIESYQAFADALLERAEQYDPIESLFQIFSMRKAHEGEERAKRCLRCDLEFVDTVNDYLFKLAEIAQDVANSNGDISDFVLE